jgi:hypothetical protein
MPLQPGPEISEDALASQFRNGAVEHFAELGCYTIHGLFTEQLSGVLDDNRIGHVVVNSQRIESVTASITN